MSDCAGASDVSRESQVCLHTGTCIRCVFLPVECVLTVLFALLWARWSLSIRQQARHGEQLPSWVLPCFEGASRGAEVKLLPLHLWEAAFQPLGRGESRLISPRLPLLLRGWERPEGAHPTMVKHAQGGAVQVRWGELGMQVQQGGREVSGGKSAWHGTLALIHGGEGVRGRGEGEVEVFLHGGRDTKGSRGLAGHRGITAGLGRGGEDHQGGGGQWSWQVGGAVHLEGAVKVHSPPCSLSLGEKVDAKCQRRELRWSVKADTTLKGKYKLL